MQHIEKSAFRRGEYVGYAQGRVFMVKRVRSGSRVIGWEARAASGSFQEGRQNYAIAPTLAALDRELAAF